MSDALAIVATFPTELDAQLAQAVLDANAIDSMLVRDDASGMLPWLNVMHPVRLGVRPEDAALALELLAGVEGEDGEPDDPAAA